MYKFILSLGFLKYINSAFPFLILPVVTRILGPEDFALYFLANIWMTALQPFLSLNIQTGQRKLSVENSAKSKAFCMSTFGFLTLMTACLLAIGVISSEFGLISLDKNTVLIVVFATLGVSLNSSLDTYFVTRFRGKSIYIYSLSVSFCVWGGMLALLLTYQTWTARLISQGLVYSVFAFFWFCSVINRAAFFNGFSALIGNIVPMLRIGLPLVIVVLCELSLFHLDKFFSQSVLSSMELAKYVSFFQVAIIPLFFTVALAYGLEPLMLRDKKTSELLRVVVKVLILIVGIFLAVFIFQAPMSFIFVDQKIGIVDATLSILIIACFFKALIVIIVPFYVANGKQRSLVFGYLLGLVAYVPLLYFANNVFGVLGIASAFMAVHILVFCWLAVPLRRFLAVQ